MITCDYCGQAAVRRIHVDQESGYSQPKPIYEGFDDVADHYKALAVSRYACLGHLQAGYDHVVQAVDPGVHILLDPEL